jgi:adenine/guanine phosphoribosyltransferase-like PRPP-binding protein
MDPKALLAVVRELAATIDMTGIDYVVGFPEGGAHPAFAFALIVDRPLILSTRLRMELAPPSVSRSRTPGWHDPLPARLTPAIGWLSSRTR